MTENTTQMSIPKRAALRSLYALGSPFSDNVKLKRAQLLIDLIPERRRDNMGGSYLKEKRDYLLGKSDVRKAKRAELLAHEVAVSTSIKSEHLLVYSDTELKQLAGIHNKALEIQKKADEAISRANGNLINAMGVAVLDGAYRGAIKLLK
ncbi:MAG: hypothetical protein V1909_04065 [Candidatus Micrarchaeota archaeon]